MIATPPPSERSAGVAPALFDPHLPMLVRVTGRTMLVVFAVVVLTSLLPLSPRSPAWGVGVSTRIIEVTSFALVGVACLRVASFLEPLPDYDLAPDKAMQVLRRRNGALRFCHLGVISLALLALWQVVLLLTNTSRIEQELAALSSQVSTRIAQTEQQISQASAAAVQQQWQQLTAARTPGISPAISAPEQQRQALLNKLKADQKQADRNLSQRGNQERFSLVISTLRRLALCVAFILGFHALGRRIR
jgi:hypothetical protein